MLQVICLKKTLEKKSREADEESVDQDLTPQEKFSEQASSSWVTRSQEPSGRSEPFE